LILEQTKKVEIHKIIFKLVSAETQFCKHNIVYANIRT